MDEHLVIVESPAKAKTITRFLGKGYTVKSSFGHVRDLSKKDNIGINIEGGFEPYYEISPDKKKVVTELKKLAKQAKTVWLASDEDREGEAIAWHLAQVLGLSDAKSKRIVFHEITKEAISKAVKEPRQIDQNLVNAQQARRILDRLVGFELSPILWKKIKPQLSAGRVQSVAVRLLVEREREVMAFKSSSSYRTLGYFKLEGDKQTFRAELNKRFSKLSDAKAFLEKCAEADYTIGKVEKQPSVKNPAAPFTTSTLQQEASRKLGFSVSQTMTVAQRLYEAGLITYMRTDSVNLSNMAMGACKQEILKEFGDQYVKPRSYRTKSKGAQEAHEAIRPTYLDRKTIDGNATEKRLYDLIRKRTIASQMKEARFEKTTAEIKPSNTKELFIATGEVLKFDGFLKVYKEGTDDEEAENQMDNLLPAMKGGEKAQAGEIISTERFTHHPPRYTEASLVRKLEELGIGRPSTYAPTISTVQNRGYVVKEDRDGKERKYTELKLKANKVSSTKKTEKTGYEKNKLFPTDVGMVVNDFLVEHFPDILDYNFTAQVEKEFDEIAEGKRKWDEMIEQFYEPFHKKVEVQQKSKEKSKGARELGKDPQTGKPIYVKIGRYGPLVQMGETSDEDKPRFASLLKGQHMETITLEDALDLFKLPRDIGQYEGEDVVIGIGRFGPYARHKSKFYSLKKTDDPLKIELGRAIELIEEKRERDRNKFIKKFDEDPDTQILNGRWGPYVAHKGNNYRIPKGTDPKTLSHKDCMELVEKGGKGKAKPKAKAKATKKSTGSKTKSSGSKTKSSGTKKKK